jgi:hypothetical protein
MIRTTILPIDMWGTFARLRAVKGVWLHAVQTRHGSISPISRLTVGFSHLPLVHWLVGSALTARQLLSGLLCGTGGVFRLMAARSAQRVIRWPRVCRGRIVCGGDPRNWWTNAMVFRALS